MATRLGDGMAEFPVDCTFGVVAARIDAVARRRDWGTDAIAGDRAFREANTFCTG